MERVLAAAPGELTEGKLRRIGEGIGRVVYASTHWVVKRERSPREVVALILLWRLLRRAEGILPGPLRRKLLHGPSRQIRLLRLLFEGIMLVVPRGVWFTSHIR